MNNCKLKLGVSCACLSDSKLRAFSVIMQRITAIILLVMKG